MGSSDGVKVVTASGKVFRVPSDVLSVSGTIGDILRDVNPGPDAVIPVAEVGDEAFQKFLDYATYFVGRDEEIKDFVSKHIIGDVNFMLESATPEDAKWIKGFLMVDKDFLFEIAAAANYLNAPGLLKLTAKSIADGLKGKSTAEMRKYLNYPASGEVEKNT